MVMARAMRLPGTKELVVGVVCLCVGGALNFLVTWGSVSTRVEAQVEALAGHVQDNEVHQKKERSDAIEQRVERLSKRVDDFIREQNQVNQQIIQGLGRIEGKLD